MIDFVLIYLVGFKLRSFNLKVSYYFFSSVIDAKAQLFIAATWHVVESTHGSVWVVGK